MSATNEKKSFKKKTELQSDARTRREEIIAEQRRTRRDEGLIKRRFDAVDRAAVLLGDDAEQSDFLRAAPSNETISPNVISAITGSDPNHQHAAIVAINESLRNGMSMLSPDGIVQVIPYVLNYLNQQEHIQLAVEGCKFICYILHGSSEYTNSILEQGLVQRSIQLLTWPFLEIVDKALNMMGNVAGEGSLHRDYLLSHGALPAIYTLLETNISPQIIRQAAWVISNIFRHKPRPIISHAQSALASLGPLLFMEDREILSDSCWALAYLSDGSRDHIQALIDAGLCRRLCDLMRHPEVSVHFPALKALSNCVMGDNSQTQAALNCGMAPNLVLLLNSTSMRVRKEVCWTLSNILAGTELQIEMVLRTGVVPDLIEQMNSPNFPVRREAIYGICNLIECGTRDHILSLIHCNPIPSLCFALDQMDPDLVLVSLQATNKLLLISQTISPENLPCDVKGSFDDNGIVSILEKLQENPQREIYALSTQLLERYFQDDEELPEDSGPSGSASGFGMFEHNQIDMTRQSFQFQ
eukprot:TRINITY_DN11008_c0_g1_i1.p1 TRINITY_DN11008_c0_g1~~TRINITY_DN11008_c0_g1_i1.p1  ORF type:complete len:528 (-),score=90.42 TRINITY_DN11008_c0_g1_i1:192-1775(-)